MTSAPLTRGVSLLAIALLTACGTESHTATLETAAFVPPAARLAADVDQFSDWATPVNLGPVVKSSPVNLEVAISKDGLSLYIASNRSGNFDIWVSRRASVDKPWGPPQNLGPVINTSAREQAPLLTLDGHRMYFFSDRPAGFGGTDLYVSRRPDKRDDFGWQTPVNLGGGVNASANETLPVLFEDDETGTTTLYFNSNRTGQPDVYASTLQRDGTFGPAVCVEELSSPRRDRILSIRRDGLEIFLASDRPGPTASPSDLWVSTRASTSDPWSTPVNLGPVVNSTADEGSALLSFDETALYFTSNRPGGSGGYDLYVSTRTKLKAGRRGGQPGHPDVDARAERRRGCGGERSP
ncbi:MAG: hypothetical protein ACREJ4_08075 [Candidatus Methylomirabilaceae bacterium]